MSKNKIKPKDSDFKSKLDKKLAAKRMRESFKIRTKEELEACRNTAYEYLVP
jgi:hypothetical protein